MCKKLARTYFEPNKKTQARIDLLKQENKSLKSKISRIAVRMAQLTRQGFKAGATKLERNPTKNSNLAQIKPSEPKDYDQVELRKQTTDKETESADYI